MPEYMVPNSHSKCIQWPGLARRLSSIRELSLLGLLRLRCANACQIRPAIPPTESWYSDYASQLAPYLAETVKEGTVGLLLMPLRLLHHRGLLHDTLKLLLLSIST